MILDNRNGIFISKILITLIVQTILTFIVMKNVHPNFGIFSIIALAIIVIVLFGFIMLSSLSIYIKFGLFSIVSVIIGMLLSSEAVHSRVSTETIKRTIWSTVGIFTFMFVMGLLLTVSGYDLSIFGAGLFIALTVLLVCQLVSIFYPVSDRTIIILN